MYRFKSYWHKKGQINMSTKQGILKLSLMLEKNMSAKC